MIRTSPQRDRRSQRRQARIDDIEQGAIFHSKKSRYPGVVDIVDDKARLQAIDRPIVKKARGGATQLIRSGPVFGIVDDKKIALNKWQGDVQCARLGGGLPRWSEDDIVARRQSHFGKRP